jgi:hypothetical protein
MPCLPLSCCRRLNTTRRLPFRKVGLEPFLLRALLKVQGLVLLISTPMTLALPAMCAVGVGIVVLMVKRVKVSASRF